METIGSMFKFNLKRSSFIRVRLFMPTPPGLSLKETDNGHNTLIRYEVLFKKTKCCLVWNDIS